MTAIRQVRTRTRLPLRPTGTVATRARTPQAAGVQPVSPEAGTNDPLLAAVRHLNRDHALILIGGKTRILWETNTDDAGFRLLETRAFHDLHAASMVPSGDKPKSATQEWLRHTDRRTLLGVSFSPAGTADPRMFNTWRGFAIEPDPEGDCSLFLEHLRVNVARSNAAHYRYILGWFAQMIQRLEDKIGVSLGLRGPQGTGKTKAGQVIGRLFPSHYILLDQAGQLTGRFSGHLDSRLLIHADEAFFAGSKAELGRLKNLVTSDRCPIERKNQDIVTVPNFARLLITSNNEWVVQAAPEERRFAVFDVGNRNLQDHAFFAEMDRQLLEEGGLGRLLHELQAFDLSTVDLRRIPQTDALIDQKVKTLDPMDRFFYERLTAGQLSPHDVGWRRPIVKTALHEALIEHVRKHHTDRTTPTSQEFSVRIGKLFLAEGEDLATITERTRAFGGLRRCWRMPPYATCCERFELRAGVPILRVEGDPDDTL